MRTLAELRAADARHHLHPFTDHAAMQRAGGTQVITRGEGCYLYDAENRRLLDGLAGLWCVNVGYSRPEIIAAVTRQMEQLPYYCSFFNSTTEPAILLAEKLASLAPERLNHTLFCSGGSEANDTAVKLIRGYWTQKGRPEKRKMLSRTYSYHGVTVAATSLTGLPGCYQPFDLPLPDFVHVPGPYAYASGTGMNDAEYGQWCLEETERVILREGPGTLAAIFVEPVQGAGGVIVPPPGHL